MTSLPQPVWCNVARPSFVTSLAMVKRQSGYRWRRHCHSHFGATSQGLRLWHHLRWWNDNRVMVPMTSHHWIRTCQRRLKGCHCSIFSSNFVEKYENLVNERRNSTKLKLELFSNLAKERMPQWWKCTHQVVPSFNDVSILFWSNNDCWAFAREKDLAWQSVRN
jgi:hypothetical protein